MLKIPVTRHQAKRKIRKSFNKLHSQTAYMPEYEKIYMLAIISSRIILLEI